jgi:hypothetical protein
MGPVHAKQSQLEEVSSLKFEVSSEEAGARNEAERQIAECGLKDGTSVQNKANLDAGRCALRCKALRRNDLRRLERPLRWSSCVLASWREASWRRAGASLVDGQGGPVV